MSIKKNGGCQGEKKGDLSRAKQEKFSNKIDRLKIPKIANK